jgi:hypothetical protein
VDPVPDGIFIQDLKFFLLQNQKFIKYLKIKQDLNSEGQIMLYLCPTTGKLNQYFNFFPVDPLTKFSFKLNFKYF